MQVARGDPVETLQTRLRREAINVIQSVGFPIFIALLFYIDLRKVVNRNTNALDSLAEQQRELVKVLRNNHR